MPQPKSCRPCSHSSLGGLTAHVIHRLINHYLTYSGIGAQQVSFSTNVPLTDYY